MTNAKLKSVLLAGGIVAGTLGLGAPAFAACDNRDLRGEYLFTLVDARFEYPPGSTMLVLDFCDQQGTAVFDSAGGMTVTTTRRCGITGTVTESNALTYTVNPDCSFTVQDPRDPPDPVHGQIVDHGRMLLLDGTTRTDANKRLFHGVAAKR